MPPAIPNESPMKRFVLDCLGAIIIVALASLALPLYTDHRARHEVEGWLSQLQPTQQAIAARAQSRSSLQGSGREIPPPRFEASRPALLQIEADGRILLKGGHSGQMLLLIPHLDQRQVRWTCVGGPDDAMPERCRVPLPSA